MFHTEFDYLTKSEHLRRHFWSFSCQLFSLLKICLWRLGPKLLKRPTVLTFLKRFVAIATTPLTSELDV